MTLPLAVPVLSVDRYVRYSRALGVAPSTEERQELGRLPQFFADRQGWDRFVAGVEAVWRQLPDVDRQRAVVFTGNYGEAGAIERWPDRADCGRSADKQLLVVGTRRRHRGGADCAGADRARLDTLFTSVEKLSETECGDCMPYENHIPIFVCRGMKTSLAELWPSLKHYE